METWHAEHPCRCGHPAEAHEHYRPGTECALCDTCPAYRPESAWERLAWALRRRDSDARLHDAVMTAAARDQRAHETGRKRDNVRAVLAVAWAGWLSRRARRRVIRHD